MGSGAAASLRKGAESLGLPGAVVRRKEGERARRSRNRREPAASEGGGEAGMKARLAPEVKLREHSGAVGGKGQQEQPLLGAPPQRFGVPAPPPLLLLSGLRAFKNQKQERRRLLCGWRAGEQAVPPRLTGLPLPRGPSAGPGTRDPRPAAGTRWDSDSTRGPPQGGVGVLRGTRVSAGEPGGGLRGC